MDALHLNFAATFTAEPVKRPLGYLMQVLGIPVGLNFAGFNQVFQELLSPASTLASNAHGCNVLLIRVEDLAAVNAPIAQLDKNVSDLCGAIASVCPTFRVPTIVALCPPSANALARLTCEQIRVWTDRLVASASSSRSLHLVALNDDSPALYDNPSGAVLGAIPYNARFYSQLAIAIARKAHRLLVPPHKVVVLDCDNTLWKGVCGEDGVSGIELDPPRRFLQEFMVKQAESGTLLCICSKNNPADVAEVFKARRDFPLKSEHIVSWRVNWLPKSENIKSLAQELQLGLDSFIFVDDSPMECAEVKDGCPEVLTCLLPPEPAAIPELLGNHWAFDHLAPTEEDRKRTEMYRANAARTEVLASVGNLEDFLEKLELKCDIRDAAAVDYPRVAQLTQRTNQFNANPIRRTENEIQDLLRGGRAHCQVVEVRDRFGDYGLVGAMLARPHDGLLDVDMFLLSCRALGRGVEYRMLSALGLLAEALSIESVLLRFTPTAKNMPVSEFLHRTGENYKETHEQAPAFRYPSAAARDIRYSPDERPRNVNEKPAAKNPAEAIRNGRAASEGLMSIASELHDCETLLRRIEGPQKPRPQLKNEYLSPSSKTQEKLVPLFEQVLKTTPVGIKDDYFELGGDSLSAVSLCVQIERTFGSQVPIATLITCPTIEQLAARLDNGVETGAWRHLVPIQTQGSLPPLFCMHAAGGNVLFYRDLARHLGPNQPVYGLQAREKADTGAYPDTVEEMASLYIREMLQFHPEGPFLLCGSSFGGLVAFEVGRILKEQGKTVWLLALFDTYGPGYPRMVRNRPKVWRELQRALDRLQLLGSQLANTSSGERLAFLKRKIERLRMSVRRRRIWRRNQFEIEYRKKIGQELPKDMVRYQKAIQQALECYKPRFYPGILTLYRAATQPRGVIFDHYLGWKDLAQTIEVMESPGTHGAMTVDPFARPLAVSLTQVIASLTPSGSLRAPEAQLSTP